MSSIGAICTVGSSARRTLFFFRNALSPDRQTPCPSTGRSHAIPLV